MTRSSRLKHRPQMLRIPPGWRTKHARIFATELRCTFVADCKRGRFDPHRLRQHQPAGLKKAKLLLILNRCQRSQCLELAVKGRATELRDRSEFVDVDRVGVALPQGLDCLHDTPGWTVCEGESRHFTAMRPSEKPVAHLADHQRRDRRDRVW